MQEVYVREGAVIRPLDARYRSPYGVLVREWKKLLVEIGATRTWVSIDPLKPYVGAGAPVVAQPPLHSSLRKNYCRRDFLYYFLISKFCPLLE